MTDAEHETALVPPFIVGRQNYTAMIPHDMQSPRLMLVNKGNADVILLSIFAK